MKKNKGLIESKNSFYELLDSEIESKINIALEEKGEILTRDEVKEIVQEIIPEIHKITAQIVKEHFNALATYIIENF
jgi:DNA primase large subunit